MQGVTNQANSSLKSILEQHGISGTPTLLQQLVGGLLIFFQCRSASTLLPGLASLPAVGAMTMSHMLIDGIYKK